MTINDIKNYIDNYVIQNGKVYLKSNNQQVLFLFFSVFFIK